MQKKGFKFKRKMNFLYKISFILCLLCLPLLALSVLVAYVFDEPEFSVVFSGAGAFLAFLGIILGMLSKPKKPKKKKVKNEEPPEEIPDITFTVVEKEFSPDTQKEIPSDTQKEIPPDIQKTVDTAPQN
ncbi:MAG: hypothetical protein UFA98_02490 [Ruminococcus sp.]|nr:hypothetical protein [Ruminococcus sp.]